MISYIWPKDDPGVRRRVKVAVGLLVAAKLLNISGSTLTIRKHSHIADLRLATTINIEDAVKTSVNAVYENDKDNFKFNKTARKVEPPSLEDIKVDPDGQMSDDIRKKFHDLNQEFSHVFTTTPGRYSGFYGDVSTNLQFTTKPVQNKKVATPGYSPDMTDKLAEKMNQLYDFGV